MEKTVSEQGGRPRPNRKTVDPGSGRRSGRTGGLAAGQTSAAGPQTENTKTERRDTGSAAGQKNTQRRPPRVSRARSPAGPSTWPDPGSEAGLTPRSGHRRRAKRPGAGPKAPARSRSGPPTEPRGKKPVSLQSGCKRGGEDRIYRAAPPPPRGRSTAGGLRRPSRRRSCGESPLGFAG